MSREVVVLEVKIAERGEGEKIGWKGAIEVIRAEAKDEEGVQPPHSVWGDGTHQSTSGEAKCNDTKSTATTR